MNSNQQLYDLAIVGGGLAGLTLALQMRKKGYRVILFEKESYPMHRVCGEYISMESAAFLFDCGVDIDALKLPRISQLHVTAPSGYRLSHALTPGGFGISRYKLDDMLAKHATDAGVDLLQQTAVTQIEKTDGAYTVTTRNATYQARMVAGTWGKRSNIDVKWNRNFVQEKNRRLSRYIGIKYHVQADLPHNLIELHNFKDGYCGISKIEDDRYCMCYLTTAENLKLAGGDIKQMEERILHNNPYLKTYFTQFASFYEKPLAISQISFERKETAMQGIPFAGDSAGLITPLCGNGMSMALHASKLLSQQLDIFLQNDTNDVQACLEAYKQQWEKHFSGRMRAGRMIQSMFGSTILTEALLRILKPFPLFVGKLVDSTHGDTF